jgi:hypothetical protein
LFCRGVMVGTIFYQFAIFKSENFSCVRILLLHWIYPFPRSRFNPVSEQYLSLFSFWYLIFQKYQLIFIFILVSVLFHSIWLEPNFCSLKSWLNIFSLLQNWRSNLFVHIYRQLGKTNLFFELRKTKKSRLITFLYKSNKLYVILITMLGYSKEVFINCTLASLYFVIN